MKKIITIILIFAAISQCGDLLSKYDSRFAVNATVADTNIVPGSTIIINENKPLQNPIVKSTVASLIIPGLGQYFNKSEWWKTAAFVGIEVVGIYGYFNWSRQADDIRSEFERWADDHWDMSRWVSDSATLLSAINSNGYPEVNDVIIDGSHHINIRLQDGSITSSDILASNPNFEYVIELRDWDFYEGVGKYDQFVAGWDDALTDWEIIMKKTGGDDELIVMTPNKKEYIQMRDDSNVLYKRAKFAATAIIFNHVFSAVEAFWTANNDNKTIKFKAEPKVSVYSQELTLAWSF